jgi:NADH-quinone oxidoreductase subunit E
MASEPYASLLSGFGGEAGDLIPILQRVQQKDGFLSETSIREISDFLGVSENQVFGVASFYSQFRFSAPGRHSIRVCLGTACHVRSGQILADAVSRELDVLPGETTADGRFDLQRVACLGCCALAPVIQVDDEIHSRVTVIRLKGILAKYE